MIRQKQISDAIRALSVILAFDFEGFARNADISITTDKRSIRSINFNAVGRYPVAKNSKNMLFSKFEKKLKVVKNMLKYIIKMPNFSKTPEAPASSFRNGINFPAQNITMPVRQYITGSRFIMSPKLFHEKIKILNHSTNRTLTSTATDFEENI